MDMYFFLGGLCVFFTIMVIFKPDYAWSILSAVCWMVLMWYALTNNLFADGDFGDTAVIGICVLASAFVLLYTINDKREKKKRADAESGASNPRAGSTRESSDAYYDRMSRLTSRKK